MTERMKLLILLFMVTRWIQQSDSHSASGSGCSSSVDLADNITIEILSLQDLSGMQYNKSTAQCMVENICCLDPQDSYLPSNTAALICINPTSIEELSTTITTTVTNSTTVTSTTTHRETVNALTTVSVSICPTRRYEASHLLTSSCPSCTPRTVTTTNTHQQQPPTVTVLLSNMTQSCPTCRTSTVTTTIYQQSSVVLSNEVGIGILATSVVVICLPILTLVILTYCWIRTRRVLKKKRGDPEIKFVYMAQDSFPKSLNEHTNGNTETAKEIDTPLYKDDDKTQTPTMNLKPISTAKHEPSRPSSTIIHKDQIAELAKNLKPIATTEPRPPRHPSSGPTYATPWKLKKKEDEKSKPDTKIVASEEKSGKGVAVGVVTSQDKSQLKVESEESIQQTSQKQQVGKEKDKRECVSKNEPQYARPVVPAKGKKSEGRLSENKRRACENQYDTPVVAAKKKESVGQASATNKGIVQEYQYDTPVTAAKKEGNKGPASGASKQNVLEHEYDKPVVAAKPKKLQSKKDKGVDSEGKEEHKYYVLEGPIPRSEKKQEGKEDHKYHILEGPAPRERSYDKKPDIQEGGGNVYHVLEGPTPKDESDAKKRDKQEEGGHVYHVLEGPPVPLRDEKSDRNPPKQEKENVYHVLEGPLPKSKDHSKSTEEQKRENIYHVLEGPTPIKENNS